MGHSGTLKALGNVLEVLTVLSRLVFLLQRVLMSELDRSVIKGLESGLPGSILK